MKKCTKFIVLICLLTALMAAEEDNWLKSSDYANCDDLGIRIENANDLTDEKIKENALQCHKNSLTYDTFKCCYVHYTVGDKILSQCHFLKNTAKSINFYKKNSLKDLDDVQILCKSNYMFIGLVWTLLIFLF